MRYVVIPAIVIASFATPGFADLPASALFHSAPFPGKKPRIRPSDITNTDLKKAQGVWSVVRYKVEGMGVGKTDGTGHELIQVVISGRRVVFQYHRDDPRNKKTEYIIKRIDSTVTPKEIDAVYLKDGKEFLRKGIFRYVESVIACEFAKPGQPRPRRLQATEDEPTQFLILRRPKPKTENKGGASSSDRKPVAAKESFRIAHKVYRSSLAFSPDGRLLAINVQYTDVWIWDVNARKPVRRIKTGRTFLRMQFSPDGKTIATGGIAGDGDVCLWEVATGKRKRVLATEHFAVSSLEFAPDGKSLIASVSGGEGKPATCNVWDPATGRIKRQLKTRGAVFSAAFSADGRLLATVTANETVDVWEFTKGRKVLELTARRFNYVGGQTVVFSPDGKTLATSNEKGVEGKICLREVDGGKMRHQFGKHAFAIAFSPDGKKLLSGHFESARLWDTATGKLLKEWKGPAMAVAFSPDGRCLAWGNSTGTMIQYFAK